MLWSPFLHRLSNKSFISVTERVPQTSVLASTLINLYINELIPFAFYVIHSSADCNIYASMQFTSQAYVTLHNSIEDVYTHTLSQQIQQIILDGCNRNVLFIVRLEAHSFSFSLEHFLDSIYFELTAGKTQMLHQSCWREIFPTHQLLHPLYFSCWTFFKMLFSHVQEGLNSKYFRFIFRKTNYCFSFTIFAESSNSHLWECLLYLIYVKCITFQTKI